MLGMQCGSKAVKGTGLDITYLNSPLEETEIPAWQLLAQHSLQREATQKPGQNPSRYRTVAIRVEMCGVSGSTGWLREGWDLAGCCFACKKPFS